MEYSSYPTPYYGDYVTVNYATSITEDEIKYSAIKLTTNRHFSFGIPVTIYTLDDIPTTDGAKILSESQIEGYYQGCITYPTIRLRLEKHSIETTLDKFIITSASIKHCIRCDIYHPTNQFDASKHTELENICAKCVGKVTRKLQEFSAVARKHGGKGTLKAHEWVNILKKSKGACHYCDEYIGFNELILEHQIPLIRGGNNSIDNVVAACRKCNSSKGSRTVAEWRRSVQVKQLLEQLQIHLNLSQYEVTQLAIECLAIQEGLLDKDDREAEA